MSRVRVRLKLDIRFLRQERVVLHVIYDHDQQGAITTTTTTSATVIITTSMISMAAQQLQQQKESIFYWSPLNVR